MIGNQMSPREALAVVRSGQLADVGASVLGGESLVLALALSASLAEDAVFIRRAARSGGGLSCRECARREGKGGR